MLNLIHVRSEQPDLREIILAGEAGDANLTACLLYLLVASNADKVGGVVEVSKMATAFSVGDFTVTRWIRRLAKMGLVVVRLSGHATMNLEIKLKRGLGDSKNLPGRAPESLDAFNFTQRARLIDALEAMKNCPTLVERAARHGNNPFKGAPGLLKMLDKTVLNPLFDGLDLSRELMNADAWVQRKQYNDMPKFLVNWLRRAAKKIEPKRNANAAAPGKYDAAQAAAKGQ